jgi:hypothetical protein
MIKVLAGARPPIRLSPARIFAPGSIAPLRCSRETSKKLGASRSPEELVVVGNSPFNGL